jgi:putative nucleotidyltransferase with HDIG domain
METNEALDKIISGIDALPAFPQTAAQVLKLAGDSDTGIRDIVGIIRYDQAITADCLRLCNSSYFGLIDKVESIHRAVVLLGATTLVNTIVLLSCKTSLCRGAVPSYKMAPGELWRHSVSCALMSQLLAEKMGMNNTHELFTASLLHDIGKLLIDTHIADNFGAMFSLMQEEDFGTTETEKQFFGIDHAELGGILAEKWNFPPSLSNIIKNHHQDLTKIRDVTPETITVLSNFICNKFFCQSHDDFLEIDSHIQKTFGIIGDDVKDLFCGLARELKRAEDLLNL